MNSIKKYQEKSILRGVLGTILIVFLLVVRYVLGGRQSLDVFFAPILIYIISNIYISFELNIFSILHQIHCLLHLLNIFHNLFSYIFELNLIIVLNLSILYQMLFLLDNIFVDLGVFEFDH